MQFDFRRTGVQGRVNFATFGCDVFAEDPPTPDRLTPDVFYHFETHSDAKIRAPDGREVRFWGFFDRVSTDPARRRKTYPSPMIRVRQGQIVHVKLDTEHGPHTIHFHAIEPTTMNDGVGHVSFEINDTYTYQWQANEIGTFFYHCHRNTVLHFEMGMIGPLIVDPLEGPGVLYSGGPTYQVERVWLVDDVDPRWHSQLGGDHDQGLCGDDVGFNRFEPKYFMVNGVFSNKTMTDPKVMAQATLGQKISHSDRQCELFDSSDHARAPRPAGRGGRPRARPRRSALEPTGRDPRQHAAHPHHCRALHLSLHADRARRLPGEDRIPRLDQGDGSGRRKGRGEHPNKGSVNRSTICRDVRTTLCIGKVTS